MNEQMEDEKTVKTKRLLRQLSKPKDFESPYAEYLLGVFDNTKRQGQEPIKLLKPGLQVENRVSDIKTVYNASERGSKLPKEDRAQSPITSGGL